MKEESHIIEITPEMDRRIQTERRKDVRDQLAAKDRRIAELEAKVIELSNAMAEYHYLVEHPGLPPDAEPS